jgi:ketosteroid isomerase-like protein
MRRPLLRFLTALLVLTIAYPLSANAAPSRADDVLAADAGWAKAFIACDVERMKAIVSDDLTMVNLQGAVFNKDGFLKTVSTCPLTEAQPKNVKVHLYGATAVVIGTLHYKQKGQNVTLQQAYARMYVLQGGAWRLVSNGHVGVSEAAAEANAKAGN